MVYSRRCSRTETARDRYEAKTRVVTFRVASELYEELSKIKSDSGLSFADLIKLGADIATAEIEEKLTELGILQQKVEELRLQVQSAKKAAEATVKQERQERLQKLDREMEAFRLFDLGWDVEETRLKVGMGRDEASARFTEWAAMRGEREKVQEELLRKCVNDHIGILMTHIAMRASRKETEELNGQLRRCRYLVMNPSRATEEEKNFYLGQFGY